MQQNMTIKVCGMRQADNILEVENLGVDLIGFIFYPPSPRFVSEKPAYLPMRAKRVGVFVDAGTDFILSHTNDYQLDFIQLHGKETPTVCKELKRLMPNIKIIKAFSVSDRQSFLQTADYEGAADSFLFDTATRLKGGSGQVFDHCLLDNYKGHIPFLLSGGLSLENQPQTMTIRHSMLIGYDLNSRFETLPAVKDTAKLRQYLANLCAQAETVIPEQSKQKTIQP